MNLVDNTIKIKIYFFIIINLVNIFLHYSNLPFLIKFYFIDKIFNISLISKI